MSQQKNRMITLAIVLVIVSVHVGFSMLWAIRVPPFAPPDEIAHADYMFAFYDRGGFFRVDEPHRATDVLPQTKYIERLSAYRGMRYNPLGRAPIGYGTSTFFKHMDDAAPPRSGLQPPSGAALPYVMFGYPSTYYLALATINRALIFQQNSAFAPFFIARFINVSLGAFTLLLAYGVLRRNGTSRTVAAVGLAGVSMLPMFCWVSAYIQPDNLVLLILTFAAWIARSRIRIVGLSFAICALLIVKPHYGAALWLTATLFCLAQSPKGAFPWAKFIMLHGILPVIAFHLAIRFTPVSSGLSDAVKLATTGTTLRVNHHLHTISDLIIAAFSTVYGGGSAFKEYWLTYGSRGSHISGFQGSAVQKLILFGTLASFSGILILQTQRLSRILLIARRRGSVNAAVLLGSPFELNLYIIYSALLLAVNVVGDGLIVLQGRYWLPLIVPLTVILLRHLPRLAKASHRGKISLTIAIVILLFTLPINLQTPQALARDFYDVAVDRPDHGFGSFVLDSGGDVESFDVNEETVGLKSHVVIRGYAVDVITGLPANRVSILVDGRAVALAATGLPRLPVADQYFDDKLNHSGFKCVLNARLIGSGRHNIEVMVARNAGPKLRLRRKVVLIVR